MPPLDTLFFADGRVDRIYRAHSGMYKLLTKQNRYEQDYDSVSGKLIAEGGEEIWGRQGRWHFYNHGMLTYSKRYRYGWSVDSLKPPGLMRRLVYLGYGIGGGGCTTECELDYGMVNSPIGWCLVSEGEIIRAWLHNGVNDIIQAFRLGFGWKRDYIEECQ
jgi:hypothetical protein